MSIINSSDKVVKILGYVSAFVFLVIVLLSVSNPAIAAENSKSVTLRGYTFTLADADSWLTYPKAETAEGSRWIGGGVGEMMVRDHWIGWHGQVLKNAFYLPDERCEGKPSCFNDEDYDKDGNCPGCWPYDPTAFVAIYVLDKIDPSELTENSVLEEASMLSNGYIVEYLIEGNSVSEKNITFNERPAHLLEKDGMAAMSVELSPDKVAVIDVDYHDGNPWDVLERITISG